MKSIIFKSFLLLLLLPVSANANNEYTLTKYKIDVEVYENNTFFITERITAQYQVPKHGIIRKVPLRNKVIRLDGTKSSNRAKISHIDVIGDKFSVSNESGSKAIKIGDPDRQITGNKEYTVMYLYDLGKDKSKDFDELYFNLIGDEWDTTIDGIEFTIAMPKEFDASKLGFSSGRTGSTDNRNVTYEVHGNVITGAYNGVLHAGEALTVRLELPEGYFVAAVKENDIYAMLSIFLPVLFVLIVFVAWFRYGRDEPVIETVEFYPPAGFNSAETGFIYKGKAAANDVVSLLIYLADKGYIAISETQEKSRFANKKGFKITKVKEYDGDNPNERLFLNGLFAKGDHVTLDDLKNHFYITLNAIIGNLNKKENRKTIFEETSLSRRFLGVILTVATFILITIKPMLEYAETELLIFGLGFPLVGFLVFYVMIFEDTSDSLFIRIFFGGIFFLGFCVLPFFFIILPALQVDPVYMTALYVGLTCICLMLFFNKYMLKRTPYGNELLGKLRGFKNFLEIAEKPKLQEMVFRNPAYFYNILPFAYVLGVSDKWIKKFETISLPPPNWYSGSSGFSAAAFGAFMSTTMTSASSAMSSSPSRSSGGGSSGGGSGGGGGSSW